MPEPLTKERAWIREFFTTNNGASIHQCLKAMNNARGLRTFPHLVKEIHHELHHARVEAMLVSPAKPPTPGGPALVLPAHDEEDDMASNVKQQPTTTEQEALRAVAKQLLDAMRAHGMESAILTVTDKEKPKAEWEVEYRARRQGGIDL